jgi:glutathione S-transferase
MRRLLFSHPDCPYAHRTRALLDRLGLPYEPGKEGELLSFSPTGKLPLLVEPDGTVWYETRIIAAFLADRYALLEEADPVQRAQRALAMDQFDAVLVPLLFYGPVRAWPLRWLTRRDRRQIECALDLLDQTISHTPPRSLLGYALAPFWMGWRWPSLFVDAEQQVRQRPALAAWLDEAALLPELVKTAPALT